MVSLKPLQYDDNIINQLDKLSSHQCGNARHQNDKFVGKYNCKSSLKKHVVVKYFLYEATTINRSVNVQKRVGIPILWAFR